MRYYLVHTMNILWLATMKCLKDGGKPKGKMLFNK